jgi:hypothetical protein
MQREENIQKKKKSEEKKRLNNKNSDAHPRYGKAASQQGRASAGRSRFDQ